ncbi:MAG TPA: hypothetical protein VFI73_13515 [Candidatus Nitrosopolaris sp.]|nr:hypothetical protein [Candidatus Nitrosopolaris sp.]
MRFINEIKVGTTHIIFLTADGKNALPTAPPDCLKLIDYSSFSFRSRWFTAKILVVKLVVLV